MKKVIIFLLCVFISSCIKDEILISKNNLLLGSWRSGDHYFVINNTDGIPDPLIVTKKGDSLYVVLLPSVNFRFKIISVDEKNLKVSSNNNILIFNRVYTEQ